MKTRLTILLSLLIGVSVMFGPAAKAIGLEIHVGDQPYYQGADFWDYGWHWVWVPGHYEHHHWVHGYYVRHGDWSGHHLNHHHDWHHHDHDHDHDHH